MSFITRGKTNWKFLLIVIILAAIVGGGIWGYLRYFGKEMIYLSNLFEPKSVAEPKSVVEITESDWSLYINKSLGFELWIPKRVLGIDRCTNKKFFVPLKVFEDNQNGVIYVVPEYYYSELWNQELQKVMEECEKKVSSLESLRSEMAANLSSGYRQSKPFSGWAIRVKTVKNDAELDKFIKESFGSGCIVGSKKVIDYRGDYVYNVLLAGEDWKGQPWAESDCPLNYVYKVVYDSGLNKAVSVALGQDCTFVAEEYPLQAGAPLCYDDMIIKTFWFTHTE